MKIEEYRKDFYLYVVDDEESIRDVLKESLEQAGYQVEAFPTAEDALAAIETSPPHLIFTDIRMPGYSGIEFMARVKILSVDIEFIIMTSHASLETAVNAMKLGAYDYIFKPFESLADVVKSADRAIEQIFLRLQNEQLLDELAVKNKLLLDTNLKISVENHEIQLLNALMQKLSQTMEPEGVVQGLIEATSDLIKQKPVVYFKYFSAHGALVAAQVAQLPMEHIKNLGINLTAMEPKELQRLLSQEPQKIQQLGELMKEVFKVEKFHAIPFNYQGQPQGIIVMFDDFSTDSDKRVFESYTRISTVSYDNAMMAKRIHEMAIKDPLTGLYNRRYFNEKLDEELVRSRRTHHPVSLIYLDIDHFKKYNDTNGHPMGDVIIKTVAQILQKTSRKTDIVARLGGEEFAILCPHTPRDGCAIKAEKVRLTVEATQFPHGEKQPLGKLTISLGVSEYPSVATNAESLIRTSDDALYKVKQGGRNRVCMAEPPKDFKPEFQPITEFPEPSRGPKTGSAKETATVSASSAASSDDPGKKTG